MTKEKSTIPRNLYGARNLTEVQMQGSCLQHGTSEAQIRKPTDGVGTRPGVGTRSVLVCDCWDPKTQWEWYEGSKLVLQYPDVAVSNLSQCLLLFSFISSSSFLPSLLSFLSTTNAWHTPCNLSSLWVFREYIWPAPCVCFLIYPKIQLFHLLIHTWIFTEYFLWNYPWWVPEMHSPTGEVEGGLLGDYVTWPGYSVWSQKTLHCDESRFIMHPPRPFPNIVSLCYLFKVFNIDLVAVNVFLHKLKQWELRQ